jgi:hypothetical protein
MINKVVFFLFVSVFLFAQQEIYVSINTGNDSGNGTEQSPYKTINRGIQDVLPGGTVYVMGGEYKNENFGNTIVNFSEKLQSEFNCSDFPTTDTAGNLFINNYGQGLNNNHVVTINKSGNSTDGYITLKNYQNDKPKIIFDGQGGIKLGPNVNYVIIEGFEVQGPAQNITYAEAIMHRRFKVTQNEDLTNWTFKLGPQKVENGDPMYDENNDPIYDGDYIKISDDCYKVPDDEDEGNAYYVLDSKINNQSLNYFNGRGIWGGFDSHNNIIIRNNIVHDTPGSGIRFNDSDHILIENNIVYNTTWWTSSASSAIVFAETTAMTDNNGNYLDNDDSIKMVIRGNTVYNNWNRIPFFMSSKPDYAQPPSEDYGNAAYSKILDGQGLYVTRSDPNYNGTFLFENNLCVNNGKNGINFDRSNASSALIRNNTIYFNGSHNLVQDISVSVENNPRHVGSNKVAGIKANFVKNVTVVNNIVETRFSNYSALELPNVEGNRFVNNNIFVLGSISWGASNPTNNQEDSPQFVNPKSLSDDATTSMVEWENYLDGTDFSLLPSSPAIDAGDQNNVPDTDINGYPRPGTGYYFSSFENSFDGWTVWTNGNDTNQNNTIELSAALAKTGSKSIISKNRTKDFHGPKYVIGNKLEVGETYLFSVWVKLPTGSNEGTAELKLREIIDGVGTSISLMTNDAPILINNNLWTQLTADYTHYQMDSDSFFFVKGPPVVNGVGVDYFIDDFSLLPSDYPAIDFNSIGETGTTVDIGAYEYVNSSLSINDWVNEKNSQNGITLFPNPVFNDLVLINLDLKSKIKIIDVSGRKYYVKAIQNLEQHSIKIDLSHLKSGTYIVQILSEKGTTKSFKIIKQ